MSDHKTTKQLCEDIRTALKDHWDESDVQTDYFHCNFYLNMAIGKWDKPYKQTGV